MAFTHLLLRYGELFLKGKNRGYFEQKLCQNIKSIAHVPSVQRIQGRLLLTFFPQHHLLKRVFGLVSYSPVLKVKKDVEEIKKAAVTLLQHHQGTFRVETNRADKSFSIPSPQFNVQLGQYIEKHTTLEFSRDHPHTTLGVEINQDGVYLFLEKIPCHGGVPTGIEGKVFLLLENDASILAGLLMMKRGCHLILIQKRNVDYSLLQHYSPTLLKTHERIDDATIPVVSSQTFSEYTELNHSLIFRPLIAFTSAEIRQQLQKFK
ncbi:hypothetical protein HYU22_04300 [Candidatus Woesearchaeota archaeon]|nr:hypothetical protein [Candidatus Woesearchaeota archaeon]